MIFLYEINIFIMLFFEKQKNGQNFECGIDFGKVCWSRLIIMMELLWQ
jgi:hypothetical protein